MLEKPKILYIEDTADARMLVRRLLSNEYLVLEASNPLDGIELAQDTQPDLVLLDINLPDLSGREVATHLRRILPGVPLVALTADVTAGARETALAAGCVGFISKPIDIDNFREQIRAYLGGKQDELPNREEHLQAYQEELVEHLQAKVEALTKANERNRHLNQQNKYVIKMLKRRQRLLEAGARVSHGVTSILDFEKLLHSTVEIIKNEFDLCYCGIFLLSEDKQRALLRSGHGREIDESGQGEARGLPLEDGSIIGRSIRDKEAQASTTLDEESDGLQVPWLPGARSEIALPLVVKGEALGAILALSDRPQAFDEDDITALQIMADQVAIAINNAQLVQQLDEANAELLRSKTLEAIATATSEAVHWVGNKAAPIPGSAQRVRQDIAHMLAILKQNGSPALPQDSDAPFQETIETLFETAAQQGIDLDALAEKLADYPSRRLNALVDLDSTLEDLDMIEKSANLILEIKEDLIGPARKRQPETIDLSSLIPDVAQGMGVPTSKVIQIKVEPTVPKAYADPRQIRRVLVNLIKNAWEALEGHPEPCIVVRAQRAKEPGYVQISVKDNGPGIPADIQEKIWVSFFTTKSDSGGTGLGLPACMQIAQQSHGKLWVESEEGEGSTFFLWLPQADQG